MQQWGQFYSGVRTGLRAPKLSCVRDSHSGLWDLPEDSVLFSVPHFISGLILLKNLCSSSGLVPEFFCLHFTWKPPMFSLVSCPCHKGELTWCSRAMQ